MNEFITADLLLSLAGCVGIVMAGTQILKKYIKTDAKNIALVLSIIIGIVRIIILKRFTIEGIFVGLLNILPILCGAIGAYDGMLKRKASKTIITPNGDVIKDAENIIIADIDPKIANAINNSNDLTSENTNTINNITNLEDMVKENSLEVPLDSINATTNSTDNINSEG